MLRRNREVGVEDHHNVAGRRIETGVDGVRLTVAGLLQSFDVEFGVGADDALDLAPGSVARVALDKDNLRIAGKARDAADCRLDIAALVARRNDDGDGARLFAALAQRAAHRVVAQAQAVEQRQGRKEAVDQPAEPEQPER